MTCVGNDDDLREVTLAENGVFASMRSDAIFIDHTTASAKVAKELAHYSEISVLDAPVSGGQVGAENGVLSIMCGGDQSDFDRALPILESYGKNISLIGPSGAGQQCKMVNQIAIAGLVQALSEALNFSNCAGLDGKRVLDVISGGAAGSWQMNNRGETMLDGAFDFGFAVDWMRKDLEIVFNEADEIGADVTFTKEVDKLYKMVQENGGGRWDTSSLISLLKDH
ncbi:UNVERIFIED_CONTAM: hypothetical protein GTU68_035486 [Idotea baltica]|nr:hypothetical protein [Idotea baltica]